MKKRSKIVFVMLFFLFFMNLKINAMSEDTKNVYLNTIESNNTSIIQVTNESLNTENEAPKNIEVEVPDTLSTTSAILLSISMFDIFLGIGILLYVKKYKTQE